MQKKNNNVLPLEPGAGVEHDVLDLALDVLGPGGEPGHRVVVLHLLPLVPLGGLGDLRGMVIMVIMVDMVIMIITKS